MNLTDYNNIGHRHSNEWTTCLEKIRALANVRCAEFNTVDYIFITVLSYRYFVFVFVIFLLLFCSFLFPS